MMERFTREDRMTMAFAEQEARDLGHPVPGNDHLVLGMLCNARSPLFGLLGERGLTLAAARPALTAHRAEHGTGETAEETAAARYDEDREALRAIGIDLDKVREAVRGKFGDDLAEGWGGRGGRSRKGGRGGRGGCGEGHRGPRHPRSAGYGPDAFGPGGFGPGGFGPGFGPGGPRGPQEFADCADTGEQGDRRSGGRGRRGPGGDAPWEGGRGRRGPRGRGGRPRWDADVRSALRAAVDVARERGDRTLTAAHLLIGIIDTADDASRAVLTTATVPVDDLRRAVLDSLPPVGAPA